MGPYLFWGFLFDQQNDVGEHQAGKRISKSDVEGLYRVYMGFLQGVYRVYTVHILDIYRVYTWYIQGI